MSIHVEFMMGIKNNNHSPSLLSLSLNPLLMRNFDHRSLKITKLLAKS